MRIATGREHDAEDDVGRNTGPHPRLRLPDTPLYVLLARSDWADWSQSGELVFARDGRLYRISVDDQAGPGTPEELLDLREKRFESIPAPPEATLWNGRAPRGRLIQP
jgi:hypothetical protein